MTTLITGAAGFLGLNVLRKLQKQGESVRALVRAHSPGIPFLKKFGAELAFGDITDYTSVQQAIHGCSYVYHIAGVSSHTPRHQAERVHVEGTENVLRAALEENVIKVVHTSSTATIGSGTHEHPATEDSTWDLERLHHPYIDTKRAGELRALTYTRNGMNLVVVNPAHMIGAWDPKPASGSIIVRAHKHSIPFYPRASLNVIDVEDAADGHILAMEKGRAGQRYILGGQNLTSKEYYSMICAIAGARPPRFEIPPSLAYTAGVAGTIAERFHLQTRTTLPFMRVAYTDRCVNSAKAIRELGLPQGPALEAIHKAYQWLKEYHYIS